MDISKNPQEYVGIWYIIEIFEYHLNHTFSEVEYGSKIPHANGNKLYML
jgi:hypothetical protein